MSCACARVCSRPQRRVEEEQEERRAVERRYQDVLELLQQEGGRIASLQVR